LLALGAVGLACTALTEAPGWPPSRTSLVLGAGLVLAVAFVTHIRRHPDPLVTPRLFAARRFSAGAAGIVTYYTGFAAMLLAMTLRRRRAGAAGGAGIRVSGAGHGPPARIGSGRGGFRGRARRPPRRRSGRLRPRLDRRAHHRRHDRCRRSCHRPAAGPLPRA